MLVLLQTKPSSCRQPLPGGVVVTSRLSRRCKAPPTELTPSARWDVIKRGGEKGREGRVHEGQRRHHMTSQHEFCLRACRSRATDSQSVGELTSDLAGHTKSACSASAELLGNRLVPSHTKLVTTRASSRSGRKSMK